MELSVRIGGGLILLRFFRQARRRASAVEEVQNAKDRVPAQHAWSRPAHDGSHLLAQGGAVAVHQAIGAGWLGVTEGAVLETSRGVIEQFAATCTEPRRRWVSMAAAVHA